MCVILCISSLFPGSLVSMHLFLVSIFCKRGRCSLTAWGRCQWTPILASLLAGSLPLSDLPLPTLGNPPLVWLWVQDNLRPSCSSFPLSRYIPLKPKLITQLEQGRRAGREERKCSPVSCLGEWGTLGGSEGWGWEVPFLLAPWPLTGCTAPSRPAAALELPGCLVSCTGFASRRFSHVHSLVALVTIFLKGYFPWLEF